MVEFKKSSWCPPHRGKPASVPAAACRLTRFQELVYKALTKIPAGRVTTYKILARHVKCASCRAVGQALRRNPFAPVVPCHRVIASDLSLGGFNGHCMGAAVRRKQKLLAAEGVKFKQKRLADPERIFRFK